MFRYRKEIIKRYIENRCILDLGFLGENDNEKFSPLHEFILKNRHMLRHILFGQESPYWKDRESEIKYGHVVGFSKMLLENLLLRKGYKIMEIGYTIKDEYCGIRGNIEKLISKLFPRLAPQMFAVCKLRAK